MNSSSLDQRRTQTTEVETWVQEDGFNPRSNWDVDWEKRIENGQLAVAFQPFKSIHPIYCDCYAVHDEYAVLKVPPEGDTSMTAWWPTTGWSWVIVPEIFIRPQ